MNSARIVWNEILIRLEPAFHAAWSVVDRVTVMTSRQLGGDPVVALAWVHWFFALGRMRPVWREILRRARVHDVTS